MRGPEDILYSVGPDRDVLEEQLVGEKRVLKLQPLLWCMHVCWAYIVVLKTYLSARRLTITVLLATHPPTHARTHSPGGTYSSRTRKMYAISEASTILLTITLTILATLALLLRLLTANRGDTFKFRWHVDDYLCIAALVSPRPAPSHPIVRCKDPTN